MNKTLLYTGLAALVLMGAGCKKKPADDFTSTENGFSTEYFTNNGKIGAVPAPYDHGVRSIAVGDMDSDGDLDIIVINEKGNVYMIENSLPQKNKAEAEEGRN